MARKPRKIKRPSIDEAKQKALPVLMEGYNKRGRRRAHFEDMKRNPEKVKRDGQFDQRPRICPI